MKRITRMRKNVAIAVKTKYNSISQILGSIIFDWVISFCLQITQNYGNRKELFNSESYIRIE
jgi:hypothetical protein